MHLTSVCVPLQVAWRSRGLYRRIWLREADGADGAAPGPAYTALQQNAVVKMSAAAILSASAYSISDSAENYGVQK